MFSDGPGASRTQICVCTNTFSRGTSTKLPLLFGVQTAVLQYRRVVFVNSVYYLHTDVLMGVDPGAGPLEVLLC